MGKEKLVLADGTEITLESSPEIGALEATAESRDAACDIYKRITPENLKQVSIQNAAGEITGRYADLVLDHITASNNKDGTVRLIISLRGKTTEEVLLERIAALESGQQTQDAAIVDLGQTVSDMAEGGMQ